MVRAGVKWRLFGRSVSDSEEAKMAVHTICSGRVMHGLPSVASFRQKLFLARRWACTAARPTNTKAHPASTF
jgi:hypothetical protein